MPRFMLTVGSTGTFAARGETMANALLAGAPITIQVALDDLARAQAVISRYTGAARAAVTGGSAYVTIPNPQGLSADEHPFLRDLVGDLHERGIPLRSIVA
jgi:hypothetical protein